MQVLHGARRAARRTATVDRERDARSSTKRGRPRCSRELERARRRRAATQRTDRERLAYRVSLAADRARRARRDGHRRPRRAPSACTRSRPTLGAYPVDAKARAARARREAASAQGDARASCSRDLLSADARDRVGGDRHRAATPRPSGCCSCRTPRPPRSRSTRCMREAPAARARHQARARRARRPPARPLALDAGEPRRAAGDAPLLRHLREGHAELHRQAVVRRRPRTPSRRSSAAANARGAGAARLDGARARLDARPRARQGPAPAACTTASASPTRRSRPNLPALDAGFIVRRTLHRRRRSRRRRASSPTAAGRSSSARRCWSRSRRSTRRRATRSRSSIRCPPGFEAVNTNLATAERAGASTDDDALGLHEHARQPQRGVRDAPRAKARHRFSYTVARDDAGHVHRRAGQGRGDVQPRDVRPLDRAQTVVIE